ncbi:MAG: hypothetical protein L0Z07_04915, partial [Planctomycetes bacterium]|nr:hypothetical protein [Planctomycetota bacterium]
PAARAGMVSLAPSKDNTLIQQTDPGSQLSNGQGDVFVGRTGQPSGSVRRGLLAFDIAGNVPAGSIITGVTLTIRETTGNNGDRVLALHRVLQDWGEGASFHTGGTGAAAQDGDATWLYTYYDFNNPASSPTWSTPGGHFSPTVSASTIVYDQFAPGPILPPGSSFSWLSTSDPQMLADVQSWLDNPAANFGWILLGDESVGNTAKRVGSGESATPPELVITYVPEPATWALSASGSLLAVSGMLCRLQRRRKRP